MQKFSPRSKSTCVSWPQTSLLQVLARDDFPGLLGQQCQHLCRLRLKLHAHVVTAQLPGGRCKREAAETQAWSRHVTSSAGGGDVRLGELFQVRRVHEADLFAPPRARHPMSCRRGRRGESARSPPTRIAAVQWTNIGRLAGSSVIFRNASTWRRSDCVYSTGMLKYFIPAASTAVFSSSARCSSGAAG